MRGCPVNAKGPLPDPPASMFSFPQVHTDGTVMADLSMAVKEVKGDVYCSVPFCSTVESEALGAEVKLGDRDSTPLIRMAPWNSLEEVSLPSAGPLKGRMGEVMKALSILRDRGMPTAFKLTGPFTILMNLIESRALFKAVRKDRERVTELLRSISAYSLACAREATERGASIVSLAESSATTDLVGPKVFSDMVAPGITNLIKTMSAMPGNWAGHLCGRLSSSLEDGGFIEVSNIETERRRYGDSLEILRKEGVRWFCHGCVSMTPRETSRVWTFEVKKL